MRDELRPQLARVVRAVEGGPGRRQFLSGIFGRYYTWRGASPTLIDDALGQAGALNLSATRSTMRWAAAIEGRASMPKGFRPDRRLRSEAARELALEILERRYAATGDPELGRHRSYLAGAGGRADDEARAFVRSSLDELFAKRSLDPAGVGSMDTTAGFEALSVLHDTLSAAGLRPFLVSGTLLGQVRTGDLLGHDYDLDLGLLPGEGTPEAVAAALGSVDGLSFEVEDWRVWGTHRNGVAFDVFLHYEERGRYYHATSTHAWWNTPFGLVEARLRGKSFWIPDDVETYLGENYGDWRRPVAFYHKSFDTPNREYRDTPESLLYLYELAVDASRRDDRFVCESVARELARYFGIDVQQHFNDSPLLLRTNDTEQRGTEDAGR